MGLENIDEKVKKCIIWYMCTLIIDRKISFIYGLNKFFIPEKYVIFISLPKNSLFVKYLYEKNLCFNLLHIVSLILLSDDVTDKVLRHYA